MPRLFSYMRKTVRFALAALLWTHGLFVLRSVPPLLAPLSTRLSLNGLEILICAALLATWLLSLRGVGGLLVDVIYIWFFPFVCLWLVIWFLIETVRAVRKLRRPLQVTQSSEGLIVHAGEATNPKAPNSSPVSVTAVIRGILKVVTHFAPLWCALIYATSRFGILKLALAALLVQIAKTAFLLIRASLSSRGWLSQLQDKIKEQADKLIATILAAKDLELTQEIRNAYTSLTAMEVGIKFLSNRKRVMQWMLFIAGLFFATVYSYIAVLFAFGFYGTARLQHVPLALSKAIVTALFIPVSYSDLPPNFWLKFLAGMEWVFVVALGLGTVLGYLNRKLDPLYAVAEGLKSKLQTTEVRSQLTVLGEKIKQTPVVTPPSQN
jgi:hypothetical protein